MLDDADDVEKPTLERLDAQCNEGLRLLLAGQAARALVLLRGVAASQNLLERSLALPIAEAMYASGAAVEGTIVAFEAVTSHKELVSARLTELVERLPDGQAASLLLKSSGRPATSLLAARSRRDSGTSTESAVGTLGRFGVLLPLSGAREAFGRAVLRGLRVGLGPAPPLGGVAASGALTDLAAAHAVPARGGSSDDGAASPRGSVSDGGDTRPASPTDPTE